MACSEPGAIVRGTGDRPSGRVSKRVGVCVFFKEKSTVRPSRPWRGGWGHPPHVRLCRERGRWSAFGPVLGPWQLLLAAGRADSGSCRRPVMGFSPRGEFGPGPGRLSPEQPCVRAVSPCGAGTGGWAGAGAHGGAPWAWQGPARGRWPCPCVAGLLWAAGAPVACLSPTIVTSGAGFSLCCLETAGRRSRRDSDTRPQTTRVTGVLVVRSLGQRRGARRAAVAV